MRRRGRGSARPAARDRWMVSYADMVTLLFACFAALYASSVVPATATAAAATAAATASAAQANGALAEAIESAVARVDASGDVVVQVDTRGVVVSLPEAGAFAVGQADLSQAARQVMRELATVLEQETGDIRIEGHSDDVPITTSRFASNWDLSAARATEVIRFLLAQTAIAPARLSAAGYGEFRPLVPNDSDNARARNRRVDIVVTTR
jgi:chemotaxis protein MotB